MLEAPPLLVIVGATATGKTALAAGLAEALGGEVISCDASCVYRGLDVGTAKPDAELRQRVPHHLIDACEPDEDFSVARWTAAAEACIADLRTRGVPAIVAGGTGLYLRALLQGLVDSPPADAALRRRLEARETRRPGSLHRLLGRLDPTAAAAVEANNQVRLVRALEHRLLTGRRLSEDRSDWSGPPRHASLKFGLRLPRAARERRIRQRVELMIAGGLIEEVRGLIAAGLPPDARSLRAIGYRETLAHLRGELDQAEMVERIVVATRQYAKRQDTWFRKEAGIEWLDAPGSAEELPALVQRVMMTLPRTLRSRESKNAPGDGFGKIEERP